MAGFGSPCAIPKAPQCAHLGRNGWRGAKALTVTESNPLLRVLWLPALFMLLSACSSDETGGQGNVGGTCSPGDTRECVGVGACRGGQRCGDNARWGDCLCAGSMTGSDGAAEAGEGGTRWTSDPCPPSGKSFTDYSSTCPKQPSATPGDRRAICGPGDDSNLPGWIQVQSKVFADLIRTLDTTDKVCPCGPHRYTMAIELDPRAWVIPTTGAIRVSPPWELWVTDLRDVDGATQNLVCDSGAFSNCYEGELGYLDSFSGIRSGYFLILGTSADPPPARNVTFQQAGHCP